MSSTLRQRGAAGSSSGGSKDECSDDSSNASTDSTGEFFGKLKPYLDKGLDLYIQASPYIERAKFECAGLWKVLKPYYDRYYNDDVRQVFFGLTLLLFGGHFAMSIACYTALQISSLDLIKESWAKLRRNYRSAMTAAKEDEQARKLLDTDGDGQISTSEVASAASKFMKGDNSTKLEFMRALRNVLLAVDPNAVMAGLTGIWSAVVAVVAALRSQFAASVALGVSLGKTIEIQGYKYIKPLIEKQTDKQSKLWVEFMYGFICKSIAVSLSLMLSRMLSAFHSAVKGGQILTRVAFRKMSEHELLPPEIASQLLEDAKQAKSKDDSDSADNVTDGGERGKIYGGSKLAAELKSTVNLIESNNLFVLSTYVLAFYGFWIQFQAGFTLDTWYLRLVLLPFTVVEGILTWIAVSG